MIFRWVNARDNTKWSLSMTSTTFPMSLFSHAAITNIGIDIITAMQSVSTALLWLPSSGISPPPLRFPVFPFSCRMASCISVIALQCLYGYHREPIDREIYGSPPSLTLPTTYCVHSKDTILLHTKLPVHFSNFEFLLVMICCICAANVKLTTRRIKRNKEKI